MKRREYILAVFSFIVGSMLTLSLTNYDFCLEKLESPPSVSEKLVSKGAQYVVIVFSNPDNFERREAIRSTWVRLKSKSNQGINKIHPNNEDQSDDEIRHYFVVGISSVTDKIRDKLRREQDDNGDLLIFAELKDHYNTLSKKLLHSIEWAHSHHPHLLYLVKCDDDSFIRVDILVNELKAIRQKLIQESKSSVMYSASEGKFHKEHRLPVTGLYWGYFIGKARVKLKGRWTENDFFLCDRYLPYALGGGYVISADIVEYIARNSQYLQLYNSEDVSMGVWTAALSRVHRYHDTRFDTEWSSRGCNDTHIIRHKQTVEDMKQMYDMLVQTKNSKLCQFQSVSRPSYEYNWKAPPSQCCNANAKINDKDI